MVEPQNKVQLEEPRCEAKESVFTNSNIELDNKMICIDQQPGSSSLKMIFNKCDTPAASISNSSELCTVSNDVNCNNRSNEQSRASSTFASRFLTAKQFERLYLNWGEKNEINEQRNEAVQIQPTILHKVENKHDNVCLWELKTEQKQNHESIPITSVCSKTIYNDWQNLQQCNGQQECEIKSSKKEYYASEVNEQQESHQQCNYETVSTNECKLTSADKHNHNQLTSPFSHKEDVSEFYTQISKNKSNTKNNNLQEKCAKGSMSDLYTNENNQTKLLYKVYCPKWHTAKKRMPRYQKLDNECCCKKLEPVYNACKCTDDVNGQRYVIKKLDKSKVAETKPLCVNSAISTSNRFQSDSWTDMQVHNENRLYEPLIPSSATFRQGVEMHNLQDVRGLQLQLRDKQKEIESLHKCIQKYEVFAHSLRQEYLHNLQHAQHKTISRKKVNAKHKKVFDANNDGNQYDDNNDQDDNNDNNENVYTTMEHRILFLEAKLFNIYRELDQARLSVSAERSRELEYELRASKTELQMYRNASFDAGKCQILNRLRGLHHQSVGHSRTGMHSKQSELMLEPHTKSDNLLDHEEGQKESNNMEQTDIPPSLLPSSYATKAVEEKKVTEIAKIRELHICKDDELTKQLLKKINERDCWIETLRQVEQEQRNCLERTVQELKETHIALEESEKSKTKLTNDVITLTRELSQLRCLPRKVASMQCELLSLRGYARAYRESLHDFTSVIQKCNSEVSQVETDNKYNTMYANENSIVLSLEELKETQSNLELRWTEQCKILNEMFDEKTEDKRAVINRNNDEVKRLLNTFALKLETLQSNLHINPSLRIEKKSLPALHNSAWLHRTVSANVESSRETEKTLVSHNEEKTETEEEEEEEESHTERQKCKPVEFKEEPQVEVREKGKTSLNVETAPFDTHIEIKEKTPIVSMHADLPSTIDLPVNKDYNDTNESKKIIVQVQLVDNAHSIDNKKDLSAGVNDAYDIVNDCRREAAITCADNEIEHNDVDNDRELNLSTKSASNVNTLKFSNSQEENSASQQVSHAKSSTNFVDKGTEVVNDDTICVNHEEQNLELEEFKEEKGESGREQLKTEETTNTQTKLAELQCPIIEEEEITDIDAKKINQNGFTAMGKMNNEVKADIVESNAICNEVLNNKNMESYLSSEEQEHDPATLEEEKFREREGEGMQESETFEQVETEEEEQEELEQYSKENQVEHELSSINNSNNNNNNNRKDKNNNDSVVNTREGTHVKETENKIIDTKQKLTKRQLRRRQQKQRQKEKQQWRKERKQQGQRNEKKQLRQEQQKEQELNDQPQTQVLKEVQESEQGQERQKKGRGKKRGKKVLEQNLELKRELEERKEQPECETVKTSALASCMLSQTNQSEEHCHEVLQEEEPQSSKGVKLETGTALVKESAILDVCAVDRKSDLTDDTSCEIEQNESDREEISEALHLETPDETPFLISRTPLLRSKLPDRYARNSADDDTFASQDDPFTSDEVNYKQRRNFDRSESDKFYKNKNNNVYSPKSDDYDDDDCDDDDDDEKTTFSVHHINKADNEEAKEVKNEIIRDN